jgi:hypothetical protein
MNPVRKFNYSNHPLNLPKKGYGDWFAANSENIGAGLNIAGAGVNSLNPEDKPGMNVLGGAIKGAGMGSMFGPIGTAIGAVGGGIISLFTQKAQERKAEEMAAEAEKKRLQSVAAVNNDVTRGILRNYPTSGIDRPRMNKGGEVPPTDKKIVPSQAEYLAEGGETIQYNPGEQPATDKYGKLNRINSSTSLIQGAKHTDPSEGVGMTGGSRIFSDNPKLKVSKDFSKMLKKL